MNMVFCNFEDTNKVFRGKKIYQCSYCGSQYALEDPLINIMCFKKHNEIMTSIENNMNPQDKPTLNLHAHSEEHFNQLVSQQVDLERSKIPEEVTVSQNTDQDTLCTKEQIDQRLAVCQNCEHFKDHSCLLCGCVIVREKNFNNKLAHKRHSCPINKWGPILENINE